MGKSHLKIYQEIKYLKYSLKGVIQDYSEKSKIPFQVYRISHLLSSNPPYTTVTKLSLHKMTLTHLRWNPPALHQT